MAPPALTLVLVLIAFLLKDLKSNFCFSLRCFAQREQGRWPSNSVMLGAPNSSASFNLRLGPHMAMSPCFLYLLLTVLERL
jgi:hypothetical protein